MLWSDAYKLTRKIVRMAKESGSSADFWKIYNILVDHPRDGLDSLKQRIKACLI